MRPYIVNLTNNLIGSNRYYDLVSRFADKYSFIKHVALDLGSGDVKDMSPETLGKIMCSFEVGDVLASRRELFQSTHFCGDCDDFLRQLVALCLAYAIGERFNPGGNSDVPLYKKPRTIVK